MFSDTAMYVLALRSDPETGALAESYTDDELTTFGHLACAELAAGSDRKAVSVALMLAGVDEVVLSAALPFAAVAVLCPDMTDEMDEAALD